jgi:hypothetical protein
MAGRQQAVRVMEVIGKADIRGMLSPAAWVIIFLFAVAKKMRLRDRKPLYSPTLRTPLVDFGTTFMNFPVSFPVSGKFVPENGSQETPATAIDSRKSPTLLSHLSGRHLS